MTKTKINGGAVNTVYLDNCYQIVEYIYAQNDYLAFEIVERLPKNKLFNLYNKLGKPFPKYLQNNDFEYIEGKVLKPYQLNKTTIQNLAIKLNNIHCSKPKNIPIPTIKQRLDLFKKVLLHYECYSDVFDYWIKWLDKNQPKFTPVFIHADYKLNNIKFNNQDISGIFDLEFAKYSHFVEDIAWLFSPLWEKGWNKANKQIFLNQYELLSGKKIAEKDLFYWEVFAYVRFATIAMQQYHRAEKVESVELYITGWRTKSIENILSNIANKDLQGFNHNKLYNFKIFFKLSLKHKSLKYIIKGLLFYIKR